MNQREKAERFQALHQGPAAFVIPTPGDGGSARILAGLGFQALATSSGAAAGVLGRRDGQITRDEALAQVRIIVAATDLPVSADLEKGFGDAPSVVAETVKLAGEAGTFGGPFREGGGEKRKPSPGCPLLVVAEGAAAGGAGGEEGVLSATGR